MKISLLFFSLLSGMAVAMVALSPTVPFRSIGRGFFRFNWFLSLLFLAIFIPLHPYQASSSQLTAPTVLSFWIFGGLLLLLLLALSVLKKGDAPNRLFYSGVIGIGVVAIFLDSLLARSPHRTGWDNFFVPLDFFTSAGIMGSALFAMLLGHWYLVQFDLDKKLLKRVCIIFCAFVLLRIIFIATSLFAYWKFQILDATAFQSLISLNGHGIFFWMRIGMGLLMPAILAYMIYETARIGANQACTGLLYIAVIFIFMGEAVAKYLFFLKGLPI